MMRVPLVDIERYISWKSTEIAQYHCETDKVLGLTKQADTLSATTAPLKDNYPLPLSSGCVFSSYNNLDGFKLAFMQSCQYNLPHSAFSFGLDFLSFGRRIFVFS